MRARRLALIAAVLLGATAGHAQAPPPGSGSAVGVVLEVQDANQYLEGPPRVSLAAVGGDSVEVRVADDGRPPDTSADDHVYAGRVAAWPAGVPGVVVTQGELSWRLEIPRIPPDRRVWVALRSRTRAQFGSSASDAEGADAGPATGAPPANAAEAVGPEDRGALERFSTLVWTVVAAGLAVAAGLGARRLPGRHAPARPRPGPHAPRRVAGADLRALLAGPLAAHRVLVIGVPPPGTTAVPGVHGSALPDEWAAAALAAATGGLPIALLVADPGRVEPQGSRAPLEDLAEAVAGRFPLCALQGPAAWEAWAPEGLDATSPR